MIIHRSSIHRSSSNNGSVLLATMIFVLAIAAYMIYYLQLVQNSNQTIARAQRWNAALPIAEAGIEEGLALLNYVGVTTTSNASTFSAFTRPLNGGNYTVNCSPDGVVATITATGVVSAPISGELISRTVRVTAQRQLLFSEGNIALNNITMHGNDIESDSWNSHDDNESDEGAYNGYHGNEGDVASVNGAVNLGNHTIAGNLFLGPNSTWSSNPNGGVTGTIYTDWNMQFPNVTLPTPTDTNGNLISWLPAPGTSTSHTFTNSGFYIISDNGSIIVKPGVKVVLDVKQSASYNLSGLVIMGGLTNAGSVVMYQESGTLTLGGSGNGGAYNNRPENFIYFGLPGVTKITMSGNSTFYGVIYAPQAELKLAGGGNSYNFIGSLLVGNLDVDGHFNLHYDRSLTGLFYGYYVVTSWQEL
jgi:hypothetical protein